MPGPSSSSNLAQAPAGVDPTTTASIQPYGSGARLNAPYPASDVQARPVTPDHAGYQPQVPAYQTSPTNLQPAYKQQQAYTAPSQPQTYAAARQTYQSSSSSGSTIQRTELAKPALAAPTAPRQPTVDPVTTSSVRPASNPPLRAPAPTPTLAQTPTQVQPQQVASNIPNATTDRGWSNAGGTAVTLQQGETLYNLSKRYGVPVNAIMKANNITDAGQVQAGQRVVIPTYVYNSQAPVSAPDANPQTATASSSRGSLYDPRGAVPVPTTKPQQMAGVAPSGTSNEKVDPRYVPQRRAQPPAADHNVPDYSITTGSVAKPVAAPQSGYTVVSGDTLSRIASRHKVSVSALMQANGLSNSNIRLGQKLVIPATGAAVVASSAQAPAGVDPIVTGSAKPVNPDGPKPYVKPTSNATGDKVASNDTAAPARSGIDEFRWPVTGRVISGFGDKIGSNRNDGIDISVPEGTAVKAAENGVVVYAGSELEGFGNLVLIRHSGGWMSAYAHNKSIEVARGAEVRRGEVVARSGRTGNADMPKLHFELRKNSTPVDPIKYLD
ncbi:MAG: LysM peptidoglycan-binding domain-containing protein [Nitratireductor sp.]